MRSCILSAAAVLVLTTAARADDLPPPPLAAKVFNAIAPAPMPRAIVVAPLQDALPQVAVYPLKLADAKYAAEFLAMLLHGKKQEAMVTFDAGSNTLFVQASPAVQVDVKGSIARLDAGPPEGQPRAFPLRNAGAADVVQAVSGFLKSKNLDARMTHNAASNTVYLQASAAVVEQAEKLIAAMDAAPRQIMIQALVVRVPAGFLSDIGLADEAGTPALSLTARELNMFTAALRKQKEKANGGIDILSRPQLVVMDNQTAHFQAGGKTEIPSGVEIVAGASGQVVGLKKLAVETGLRLATTPRIAPNSESILLRVEMTWVEVAPSAVKIPLTLPPETTGLKEPVTYQVPLGAVNSQTMKATASVKDGETILIRGMQGGQVAAKQPGSEKSELVILLTPHVVRTEVVKPATHTESAPRR